MLLQVMGKCLFPGAGLFEMASAAGIAMALARIGAHILCNASITAPLQHQRYCTAATPDVHHGPQVRLPSSMVTLSSCFFSSRPGGFPQNLLGIFPAGRELWR